MRKSNGGRYYRNGTAMRKEEIFTIRSFFEETNPGDPYVKRVAMTARRFGCDAKTVKKYLETTTPQTPGRKSGHGRTTSHSIVDYVEKCFETIPTLQNKEVKYLIEENIGVGISESMVSRIKTGKLKITFKKASLQSRQRLDPRVIDMRAKFKVMIQKLPLQSILSGDECNIEMSDITRKYGHSKAGQRAISHSQRVVKLRYTLILFVSWTGVIHYELINTTNKAVDRKRFIECIKRLNHVKPSHLITLLDNASIHGDLTIDKFPVIWQSPYSPDFNPVEKVFGLIKSRMKSYEYTTYSLETIIQQVISNVTAADIQSFFIHCSRLWADKNYL